MAATLDARRLEVEALHQLGAVARREGEYDQARESLEASLAIAKGCGDERTTATIHRELGTTLWYLGEYNEARGCFQRRDQRTGPESTGVALA